ncbi:serine/threonine-protein kinase [Glycomyces sp. NPDC048151]|uniref:serine/threonine-protein kinase n=1 Tax=Glycomyces sp. NPDC048151 TaxID=3364002 RepID=UPI00372137C6
MPAGQLIADRYRLDALIGSGGMGQVWRAYDTGLRRDVAIKLLHRNGFEDDAAAHARFVREAQAVARIRHPGIAVLHDYGEATDDRGTYSYLVMEYIEGEPLNAVLTEGPLPPGEVMRLCAEIADALATAHDAGVIHRDIKPANIIVGADTHPRLVDFGIALLPDQTALTGPDVRLGTLTYASPEQIDGEPLTPASDLYSLGVVAYECLSGTPPFTGPSLSPVVHGHLHKPPPELPDTVPDNTRAMVLRSLEKDPARRWEGAADLAAACRGEALPGDTFPLPPPSSGKPRRRALLAAAIGAPVAAGAAAIMLWLNGTRETDGGTGGDPTAETNASKDIASTTLLPHDGLAIAAHDAPIDAMTALAGPAGPVLYTAAGTELRAWNLADGTELATTMLDEPVVALLAAANPAGGERLVAVDHASGVHTADAGSTELTPIGTFDDATTDYATHVLDGVPTLTAMTALGCNMIDLDTGTVSPGMTFAPGFAEHAALAPNQGELAVAHAEGDGAIAVHNPIDGSLIGRTQPSADWNPATGRTGGLWFARSEDGTSRGFLYNATDQRYYQADLWNFNAIGGPVALGPLDAVRDTWLLPGDTGESLLLIDQDRVFLTDTEEGDRLELVAEDAAAPVRLASVRAPELRAAIVGYADGTIRTWQR